MRTAIFLLTFLLAFSAMATPSDDANAPIKRLNVPGIGSVEYQRLFTETSQEGESLDAFAARIAPRIRAYSDATGFEACGVLATDGTRFGVVMGSNRAHIACANFSSFVPKGMKATNETIHSHGTDVSFTANRNDKALSPEQMAGARSMLRGVAGQRLDAFSSMDYAGGPGYLAAPGQVLHQNGKPGSSRIVKP